MATSSSNEKKNTNTNGVIIKVYVESPKTRSMKKTKPRENLTNAETQGYEHDRRALLLAHSRSLRKSSSEKKVPLPIVQSNSRPKIKKAMSYQPVRICSCSPSKETVPSLTIRSRNEPKEKKEDNRSEKKKSKEKSSPQFLGKWKSMLKQLSCKEI